MAGLERLTRTDDFHVCRGCRNIPDKNRNGSTHNATIYESFAAGGAPRDHGRFVEMLLLSVCNLSFLEGAECRR